RSPPSRELCDVIDEALHDEGVNRSHVTRLVIFGAEDLADADAFELNGRTDRDRSESVCLEDESFSRFGRRQDRRVLLTFEVACLIAAAGRDADISAAEDSAETTALQARLDDPESRVSPQRVVHRRVHRDTDDDLLELIVDRDLLHRPDFRAAKSHRT